MTRLEKLGYRKYCPYDAMGGLFLFITKIGREKRTF